MFVWVLLGNISFYYIFFRALCSNYCKIAESIEVNEYIYMKSVGSNIPTNTPHVFHVETA